MEVLLGLVLLLAMTGHSSAAYCVCKDGVGEQVLQKALDYACGAGADCSQIQQGAPCFQPNSLKAHCDYAVNSYFQKKGQASGSCDFSGAATVSSSAPTAGNGCSFPSGPGATGSPSTGTPSTGTPSTGATSPTNPTTGMPTPPSSGTPSTGTPSTGTPSTGTPSTGTPTTGTPSTGATGTPTTTPTTNPTTGMPTSSSTPTTTGTPASSVFPGTTGLGPTGAGGFNDQSGGVALVSSTGRFLLATLVGLSAMVLLRG